MTEVIGTIATGGSEDHDGVPGAPGVDEYYDDRTNWEKVTDMWHSWGRTRQVLTASGAAVLVAAGLGAARLLSGGDEDPLRTTGAKPPVAGAGLAPGAEPAQDVDPTNSDNGATSQWTWKGECTDVTASLKLGTTTFTFAPTIKRTSGAANPSHLYTIAKYSTQEGSRVVAAKGVSPVTANLAGVFGVVQVAAVYFPTNQPESITAFPDNLGFSYPDASIAACEPLYPAPEGTPNDIEDVVGNSMLAPQVS